MQRPMYIVFTLLLASAALAACTSAATPTEVPVVTEPMAEVPTEMPAAAEWMGPEGALVAVKADSAPILDGVADDAVWADAEPITIKVAGGAGGFSTDAQLKAVYTDDGVYFAMSYADSTESWFRSPWQKQEDGTWLQMKDPDDKGGDNNLYYEDKFAMIWPIGNSIPDPAATGCAGFCHAGENPDVKPYGNMYTAAEGEMADIWHWKAVRNLGQADDQYLDWLNFEARMDADGSPEAGRHGDPKDSGGYVENFASMPDPADATKTVADKTMPGFTSPSIDMTTGAPGFILDSEKVALDEVALDEIPAGSYIPGIVKTEFVGDRGNISAGWKYADGMWTIEFGRQLDTGSEYDVQFTDMAEAYYFTLAVFNNAQVRHAFQAGASALAFRP